jgi:hypothetical protein
VIERDGSIRAWIRVARDGDTGRFELLAEEDALDAAVDGMLAKLANRRTLYALAPAYNDALARRLELAGFDAGDEYSVMARRTVHPIKEAQAVPAVVRTIPG